MADKDVITLSIPTNPTPPIPLLLLCDTSGSMAGTPIRNVNEAVGAFLERVREQKRVANLVDVCVIGFNQTTQVLQDWQNVNDTSLVTFQAGGGTDLAAALETSMKKIDNYMETHIDPVSGTPTPILILISDGYGGDISPISPEIRSWVESGKMQLWVLAIKGYDMETIAELTKGESVFELSEERAYDFSDFFDLMATNVTATANGTAVTFPNLHGTNLRRPNFAQWFQN